MDSFKVHIGYYDMQRFAYWIVWIVLGIFLVLAVLPLKYLFEIVNNPEIPLNWAVIFSIGATIYEGIFFWMYRRVYKKIFCFQMFVSDNLLIFKWLKNIPVRKFSKTKIHLETKMVDVLWRNKVFFPYTKKRRLVDVSKDEGAVVSITGKIDPKLEIAVLLFLGNAVKPVTFVCSSEEETKRMINSLQIAGWLPSI